MTRPLNPRAPRRPEPGRSPLPAPRLALLTATAVAVLTAFLALLHPPAPLGDSEPVSTAKYAVQIANFAFAPAAITVNEGDTITWTNQDTAPHTVTTSSGPQALNSPTLSQGQSWSFTFTQPGTYSYYCAVHPSMRAQVIVRAPAPATRATTPAAPRASSAPARHSSQPGAAPASTTSTTAAAGAAGAAGSATPPASPSGEMSATGSAAAGGAAGGGGGAATSQGSAQQESAGSGIRTLSPVLLLGGLTAAIAVFCLLLVGSRAASRPDRGGESGDSQ